MQFAKLCDRRTKEALVGVEPTMADLQSENYVKNHRKNCDSCGCAVTGAVADPDLAAVIAAWSKLPQAIRAGILAMVRAAAKG